MQKLKEITNSQNPDISTNLKKPPGRKFLGRKRGYYRSKGDVRKITAPMDVTLHNLTAYKFVNAFLTKNILCY